MLNLKTGRPNYQKIKNSKCLVYSTSGDGDAARAAKDLTTNGFKNVYQMLGGINDFISSQGDITSIEGATPFKIIDAPRSLALLQKTKELVIYDTRADSAYNNKITGMRSYMNLGRIKNNIHVPEESFTSFALPSTKNSPILIYGRDATVMRLITMNGYDCF